MIVGPNYWTSLIRQEIEAIPGRHRFSHSTVAQAALPAPLSSFPTFPRRLLNV